jgi:hypothetical protein
MKSSQLAIWRGRGLATEGRDRIIRAPLHPWGKAFKQGKL